MGSLKRGVKMSIMIKRSITTTEFAKEKGSNFGGYESFWDEEKDVKRLFTLKRMQKYIDNETYKYITAVCFGDHVRFFTKFKNIVSLPMYFACYVSSEDTLYVFSNKVCSLAHYNELYGLTKEDVISGL